MKSLHQDCKIIREFPPGHYINIDSNIVNLSKTTTEILLEKIEENFVRYYNPIYSI